MSAVIRSAETVVVDTAAMGTLSTPSGVAGQGGGADGVEPSVSTRCPECGALHHQGRWRWGLPYISAEQRVCPACVRMADGTPAGMLVVPSDAVGGDGDSILFLIRHAAGAERRDDPMRRIIGVTEDAGQGIMVTATDAGLPAELGRRLAAALGGVVTSDAPDPLGFVRVFWHRPL
ncbi:hypothetical protein M2352_001662 [Azospirillum fermentarium]|uniref:hypothetical protein n=1 Tax=Azospirillum fermentarium TaxID=1233114 RepID=UPI002227FB9E|nr:hypothetical protein [Azospirillum fermentarium]MCW2246071.1 hypothetical protein [Azospirillum fermentarium]